VYAWLGATNRAFPYALWATVGRLWAYAVLVPPLLVAAWVHLYWLPKHGINGWTAEPRDKDVELVRGRRQLPPDRTVGDG
jgi:hypothetical protein